MLKPVQFNGEPRQRTIEIQAILAERVQAAKLETGESTGTQGAP
jgi:hypothetical protein